MPVPFRAGFFLPVFSLSVIQLHVEYPAVHQPKQVQINNRWYQPDFLMRSDYPTKVLNMNLHVGDHVIHWVYGFGEILRQEEKNLPGQAACYYVVQVKDLTIWVPMDNDLLNRLRSPTPGGKFKQLFEILSSPGETLSKDRFERKTHLLEEQKNASAEANCRIIRDLSSHQQETQLNDHDLLVLKQTKDSLLSEWTYSLSIPLPQAELELYRLLNH